MLKKLSKYAIDEVRMAEDYIHLAKSCTTDAVALKFQEIAKDEMRHWQYINELIHRKISEKELKDGETVEEKHGCILHDLYKDWVGKVQTEIDVFKVK